MFCPNCGNQLNENAKFCPSCGSQLPTQAPVQEAPQQTVPQQTYQQPVPPTYQQNAQQSYQPNQAQSYQPYQAQSYQQTAQPVQQEMPMKWHKFLVYFALWFSALLNAYSGFRALTGAQYGEYKDRVYDMIPGLKVPDILYGILLICLAAFTVYTALKLLKFKSGAPKLLTLLYLGVAVLALLYSVVCGAILSKYNADLSSVTSSVIGSIAGSVAMIVLNNIYYKKRAHLFVN